MEATNAGGNRLTLKRTRVKREDEDAAAEGAAREEQIVVKREVIDIDDEPPMHSPPPPPPPPKTRPSFTVAGSAAASSAAAAGAPSSAAAASSAPPVVVNQNTVRLRLQRRPKSILDYLSSLESSVLHALYQDTFTCLTIFRSLHPLAKQYLLRWLCITHPVPMSLIHSWVLATPNSQQAHAQAIKTLWELQLILDAKATGVKLEPAAADTAALANPDDPLVIFNPPFQRCLQNALSNKLDANGAFGVDAAAASSVDPERPSLEQLEEYAQTKWDGILHWMVGASRTFGLPSPEVTARLISMGLMEPLTSEARAAARPHITPAGFAFLFKDIHTQVWDVVLAYMESLEQEKMDRDQVLQFLFRLSFLKLGSGYPTAALSHTQQRLLRDLTAFGLIYVTNNDARSRAPSMYYPTRLALNLSSANATGAPSAAVAAAGSASSSSAAAATAAGGAVGGVSEGYIVLETTFRIYAFTTSAFHTALLGLFCRLDIALPNLLVGTITKESVRHALKSNISSAEIITYLETYAKADMRVNTPVLPENVVDQIRLWEQERNRMSLTEAHLFEFDASDTEPVVRLVLTEAFRVPDQILLHHAQKRLLVVTQDGYTRLKAFKIRLNQQLTEQAIGKTL